MVCYLVAELFNRPVNLLSRAHTHSFERVVGARSAAVECHDDRSRAEAMRRRIGGTRFA